jgi:hypothetical protein
VSVYHLRADHLRLIAASSVKHGIRGGAGLVFTLLTLVAGLSIAAMFITPIEAIQAKASGAPPGQVLHQVVDELGKPAVQWALSADDAQVEYLTETKPAIVSAILVVLLFALPFLVSFGAFNQLAGDIQHKGLRYVLLRTERINLFFGRFLGTYVFTLIVLLVLTLILLLYLVFKTAFYPAGEVATWLLQGYLALALLALPYAALCAWISAATDSPFVSLVIGQLVIGFYPLFVYLASKSQPAARFAGYLMPWALKYDLLHHSPARVGAAAVAMLGFTAAFLLLGARTFQKRDL